MFDWCKKVEVYNIENHFHFYIENKTSDFSRTPTQIPKLRATPIQLSTQSRIKSKTLPSMKKGLSLSRRLQTFENSSGITEPTLKPVSAVKIPDDQSTQKPFTPYQTDSFMQKTEQSQQYPRIYSIIQRKETYIDIQPQHQSASKAKVNIQKIGSTQKPAMDINIDYHVIPPLKRKNLTSTMEQTNFSMTKNLNTVSGQKIRDSSDTKGRETNLNLESLLNLTKKNSYNYLESKQVSLSASQSSLIGRKDQIQIVAAEKKYRKNSMEHKPRNPLRQASVILSQILSRDSTSQVISEDHNAFCFKPRVNKNLLKVTHLWNQHDKYTIVSRQNEEQSERSARIQQSIIYQRQFKHNFEFVQEGKFENDEYSLKLGIEKEIGCIVSLKEMNLSNMNLIASELNAYNFLAVEGSFQDAKKNVLELFQVQMSEGSYLLIKEPYTHNIRDLFHILSKKMQEKVLQRLKQNIVGILEMFEQHGLYPWRLLAIQDFVQCSDVFKLHDLSAFKQLDEAQFKIQEILDNLGDCPNYKNY